MTVIRVVALVAAVAGLMVGCPVRVRAQDTPAPGAVVAATPQDPDDEAAGKDRVRLEWKDGLSLRLGRHGRIDAKVRVQLDGARTDGLLPDEDDDASLDVARRRVGVEGELFDVIAFEIERELTGDEPWRDVFVNVRPIAAIQVQGGHFRLPFSLDENTGATSLDFVYRSLAARNLAPGRDPGAMLHGRVLPRRALRYELGVFRQDGRNARTRNLARVTGGRTVAGRAVLQPWRSATHPLEDLQVGAAFTRSDVPEGVPALRGETVLGLVIDTPNTPVLGARRRLGVEGRWRPGPASIKAEYMRVTTERRTQGVDDDDLPPLVASGWYVSGTWAVTGERKASGLARPRRAVHRGGPGAIELAGRIEVLEFRSRAGLGEPSTSPRAQVVVPASTRVLTVGVNWYLNPYVKVQINGVRESFPDASRSPLPGQGVILSQIVRVQLTL